MVQDWSVITLEQLQLLWQSFLGFVPNLLAAIIIFVIGWVIACGFGGLIAGILNKLKFNRLFESSGWKDALEKAEVDSWIHRSHYQMGNSNCIFSGLG